MESAAARRGSLGPPGRRGGRRAWLVLPLLLALPAPLDAQDPSRSTHPSLSGRVVDAGTGAPLFRATVRLLGSEHAVVTDEDGRFAISDIAPGARTIGVEWEGWVSDPQRIEVRRFGETEIRIALLMPSASAAEARPAYDLPPLGVEIRRDAPSGKLREFFERMATAPGHFITGEEIRDRAPLRTSDLLRQVPGVRLTRADFGRPRPEIGRHRGCSVDLFLDGILAPGLALDDVPPGDIAGIEVYRGASEVPIAFRRRVTCAAILIWTHDPGDI